MIFTSWFSHENREADDVSFGMRDSHAILDICGIEVVTRP